MIPYTILKFALPRHFPCQSLAKSSISEVGRCVCVCVCVCVEVILLQWRKEKAREGREKKLFYATGKYTIWLCYVVLEVP